MTCSNCRDFYLVPSRTKDTCEDCQAKQIQKAAKEVDTRALSIASVSSWIVFTRQPVRFRAAWRIG